MTISVTGRHINGEVVVLELEAAMDERGWLMEAYREDKFRELGLPTAWAQENHSSSQRGTVRGLHLQWDPPQAKLMRVTRGAAYVVAVDVRKGSPTLGQWHGVEMTAENRRMVYAPAGFARGFCALTDDCEVQYKCTGLYNPKTEGRIHYADAQIGIVWPVRLPLVSEKDAKAQTLKEWLESPQSEFVKYGA
jgi:dTDP-4-dehydrorhamnose 3,5-epimerase